MTEELFMQVRCQPDAERLFGRGATANKEKK